MTMAGEPTCNPENWSTNASVQTQPEPSYVTYALSGCIYDSESEEMLGDAYIDVPQANIKGYCDTTGRYLLWVQQSGTYAVIVRHPLYAIDSCSVTVGRQSPTGHCDFGLRKLNSF